MGKTFDEAMHAVMGPGSGTMFELTDAEVRGVEMQVFKNAPAHLGQVFDIARFHGDKDFLVYEGERWSFAKVMSKVDALAHVLVNHYGIVKGDRVAVAMRNYPEWAVSFAAITSIGAISVSMNSWWTADEMEYALDDSGARLLIADNERMERALVHCEKNAIKMLLVRGERHIPGADSWEEIVTDGPAHPGAEIDTDDDATILYTSGTTGRPKGAVSTHRAVISAILSFAARNAVDAARLDEPPAPDPVPPAFILIVPLFHVTGCVPVMLGCFVTGAKLVIMYKWDAEKALQHIQDEQITTFIGVPTQSWDLINHPRFADYDTSSLRGVGGGGAPAPAALVAKVAEMVPTGGPQLGYGMTETNAFGPGNRGEDYTSRPTSTGRTLLPMRTEVRDIETGEPLPVGERGEIWFFGPMLIRGYWNRPDATAETIVDGWLRTGDAGRLDADGFVYVEDRIKDMILRGGENVYCAEVEAAIYEMPGVAEAAVFGVPHERLGEEVAVAILRRDGADFDATDLWVHLDAKLAHFKVPNHVAFVDEPLPRNAAGKFLKTRLREMVASGELPAVSR